MDSVGQQRMSALHGGRRDKLEVSPNLWAGVGLVRGGAGTALVGDPETVAARIKEYIALGIDTFILSGYPHLEEAYRFAELVFPLLPLSHATPSPTTLVNYRAVRRNDRQRFAPAATACVAVMSSVAQKQVSNLTQWIVPLGIVLVWQVSASAGFLSTRILPAPSDVVAAGWRLLGTGELVRNMWVSFLRAIVGFAIGGGIGFAFGLANGLSDRSEKIFDSTLQMVRNVPHLALIPLVILWFGIDETAKIFLVALGVFFPIYINTQHGIRSVDPQLVEMGRVYGMTPVDPVLACHPAGRVAVHLRGRALRARHHVAHPDRR